jgi:hypothetical protein
MNKCDEFIYYDDLVREQQSSRKRKKAPVVKDVPAKGAKPKKAGTSKAADNSIDEAINLILETAEALYADQGDRQKLWGSMVKQTLKRRRPGFNERSYGARSFGELLEEAESRGLLKLEFDERSGGYVIKELTVEK